MFDPNEFLSQQVEGQLDTTLINPEDNMSGDGYQILATKIDVRQWQKKDDPSVSGLALDILWEIQDEAVKEFCNRDKVMVKQGVMLDITDTGQLDMSRGKNISLGRLREALGMNKAGQPFSFDMIQGQMCRGFVQHRVDPMDSEKIYAEIKRVGKL